MATKIVGLDLGTHKIKLCELVTTFRNFELVGFDVETVAVETVAVKTGISLQWSSVVAIVAVKQRPARRRSRRCSSAPRPSDPPPSSGATGTGSSTGAEVGSTTGQGTVNDATSVGSTNVESTWATRWWLYEASERSESSEDFPCVPT